VRSYFQPHPGLAAAGAVHRDLPFDDFSAQPLLPNKLSQLGPALALGDIDGDGDADAFLGGSAGHPGRLLANRGGGNFGDVAVPAFIADQGCEDIDAAFIDADGDGDPDLYVLSGGVEAREGDAALADRLYVNDGDGGFSTAPAGALPDMRFSGGCVAAADFDRDRDTDLFIGARVTPGAYPTAPSSRLLRNDGRGRFHDATTDLAPELAGAGMVTDAAWGDLDGDGTPDLVLATEYGPVRYFRNQGGALTEATDAAGFGGHRGWWDSVAVADVDGDGDADVAAGNFGWNTKYGRPDHEHPQLLYYGDFPGDGSRHIVEAHPDQHDPAVLLPIRGRSCSSAAMPFLKEKFATFHAFASADLAGIYGDASLARSLRVSADELASGLFRNDGDGRFSFHPFPLLAQVSPARDLAFVDANGDAAPDLVVAQNFFGPQRETGRMDGGLGMLLLGNGDGAFRESWPQESGVFIPEDAVAARVADLDGDGADDIAVATNNGPVRVFLRRAGEP
jgi:hypothetical protein